MFWRSESDIMRKIAGHRIERFSFKTLGDYSDNSEREKHCYMLE